MSLSNLMQVMALFVQYRVDKTHRGPGWWTLGNGLIAGAFAFNYLRDNPAVSYIAVFGNSFFFAAGVSLLYVGVLRFLGLKVRRDLLVGGNVLWVGSVVYFTLIDYDWGIRRILFGIIIGTLSILIARALLEVDLPSVTTSRYFLAAVFLGESFLVLLNALSPSSQYSGDLYFNASFMQIAVYLGSLITSTLWTFGFILMVNQRLVAERQKTIGELQIALDQIKTLTGILPICSHCKKIRGDEGYWEQVESYMSKHTEVEFTHGICPGCLREHFPSYLEAKAAER
jgi:hypothetical protein